MKKYLLMLIAAGISLNLVGCDSSSSSTSSKSSGSNTDSSTSSSSSDTNSSASEDSNKSVEHRVGETKEYKVGDTIAIDGEELIVTEVKRDYKSGKEYYKPASGNEYVKVNVTIKNNSGDAISVSPSEFKIIDSNGVYHDRNYILNNPLANTKLSNGGNISGSITFEVPKDDINLTLVYSPSYYSDNYVEVKL